MPMSKRMAPDLVHAPVVDVTVDPVRVVQLEGRELPVAPDSRRT